MKTLTKKEYSAFRQQDFCELRDYRAAIVFSSLFDLTSYVVDAEECHIVTTYDDSDTCNLSYAFDYSDNSLVAIESFDDEREATAHYLNLQRQAFDEYYNRQ